MFEILKALMAMSEAAETNANGFWWDVTHDGTSVLKVEVALSPEDVEFVDQARQMFAAKDD